MTSPTPLPPLRSLSACLQLRAFALARKSPIEPCRPTVSIAPPVDKTLEMVCAREPHTALISSVHLLRRVCMLPDPSHAVRVLESLISLTKVTLAYRVCGCSNI